MRRDACVVPSAPRCAQKFCFNRNGLLFLTTASEEGIAAHTLRMRTLNGEVCNAPTVKKAVSDRARIKLRCDLELGLTPPLLRHAVKAPVLCVCRFSASVSPSSHLSVSRIHTRPRSFVHVRSRQMKKHVHKTTRMQTSIAPSFARAKQWKRPPVPQRVSRSVKRGPSVHRAPLDHKGRESAETRLGTREPRAVSQRGRPAGEPPTPCAPVCGIRAEQATLREGKHVGGRLAWKGVWENRRDRSEGGKCSQIRFWRWPHTPVRTRIVSECSKKGGGCDS